MTNLETPLLLIPGINQNFLARLKKLGIETVKDLLWHFPARYEDFSQIYKIADIVPGQEATIQGMIKEIGGRQSWRRRLYLVEALVSDDSGSIRAVWFNQPYIKYVLRAGRIANFSGKVTQSGDEIYLSNPTYELLSDHTNHEMMHTGRIVPIYPETKGLTSKGIRYFVSRALDETVKIVDFIPGKIIATQNLPEINKALHDIHFPHTLEEALRARKRFAFNDLLLLQLYNLEQKLRLAKTKSFPIKIGIERIREIIGKLPFELTLSQKKSLWEIVQNLAKANPMNRLLQGDVGSGKTIVAAIATLEAAENGCQSAFMAPTEILAMQHYKTISNFFPYFTGGIAILTSSESKIFYGEGLESDLPKEKLLAAIAENRVKIIIGTHALIQKRVKFDKLGFVIVDEQHRFGVEQRATLIKNKSRVPHFLSMSATPIPRTLSLTLFGDLDLSLIAELPKNRKPIITKVIEPKNRTRAYGFIRSEVKKGRQVFVICPRIEKAETNKTDPTFVIDKKTSIWLDVKNVKEEYEKLSKKIFPDLKVAMLHGRLKSKEKEKIMKNFREGRFDILVATSVIEVGVDIPNASLMVIEGADRFGLAQLYQFRGRVGRDIHQSYCFLFTDSTSKNTRERLQSIVVAKNGFELAERDLKIRGPGEFLGTSQTGLPDLAMKAIQNPELVKNAREAAAMMLKRDPSFQKNFSLKKRFEEFKEQMHQE